MSPTNNADAVNRQRRALLELVQLDKSDLEATLPRILEADARALEVDRVSFWRLAANNSLLRCERLIQLSGGDPAGGELLAKDFPRYFAALLENKVIMAHDAASDPRTSEFRTGYLGQHDIQGLLDVPVWHRGVLVGVLCHEHVGSPRRWQEAESDFAVSVAGTIAVGLESDARRQAESRYALLTRAMEDLVWDWDLRTDHIDWSGAVFSALRFKTTQVKPDFQWWCEHVHPEDLARVTDGLTRHAASGVGVWRDEYRFRRGDGTWATIIDRGVLERSPDGKPLRMVGAMVDVSEQRMLQARLALTGRMASVGTLAAGVAHEINNPLTYVANNLSYARKLLAPQLAQSPKILAALDDVAQGVDRVQAIVRDLKTFSRPDEVEIAPLSVTAVIESALRIARNEIVHRARLRREDSAAAAVMGNSARLGQVLLNLLINAAQAIAEGNAEGNEILVRTDVLPGGRVAIEVRDTGVGIHPELLQRVFDPFFTTKPVGEGTGLGLAICHSIVRSMGGTLTLENNADRGVTARVELDAAPARATPGKGTARAEPIVSDRRRGRVLVIDDVANVGLSLQRLLADVHDVELMTEARRALEALTAGQRWDVILCDLMMPQLNGMEFVGELEKLDPAQLRRVVIMTGGAFTAQARRFMASWPYRRLEKPSDPDSLVEEINRAVAESQSSQPATPRHSTTG